MALAELVRAAILEAWGSGLTGNDVVAFVISKTGAPVEMVELVIGEMYTVMRD